MVQYQNFIERRAESRTSCLDPSTIILLVIFQEVVILFVFSSNIALSHASTVSALHQSIKATIPSSVDTTSIVSFTFFIKHRAES